jgi:vanillate O-demethylase ferredoxin subunit
MDYLISDIIERGTGVKEFQLRRLDGGTLEPWRPGSHIMLRFRATNGCRYERHYSLVGVPGAAKVYRIAVQREANGKGGSRSLHDELRPGMLIEVDGPHDGFPLDTSGAGRVLLVAGGIGITPLISMAHALGQEGKPYTLHYLARNAERLQLLEELSAATSGTLLPHLSELHGKADLEAMLGPYQMGDTLYACGPTPLLQALVEAGQRQGWPAAALRFESFGGRAQAGDVALTVELSLSEMTVDVAPGTSILDALIAADVFVSYECKRGECGNCYTEVLEGQPLHRDLCLTPAMRAGGMCTCVSWAGPPGRLVLAL